MRTVLDTRTATPHYPGIGRYTFELARALAAITELTLLVNPYESSKELDLWSVPARRIAVPHGPRSLAQQWVVPARLRRFRASVYHSPFYLMPYWPGCPTIVTAYDVIALVEQEGFTPGQRRLYRLTHRLAFNAARHILTLSEAARADFIQHFNLPGDKISAVPPGLANHFRPPEPEAVAAFRQERGLPGNYVLTVGINKPHKNLPGLIRAYAALPASAPPLVIAGPEDARFPEMRPAAEPVKGRVVFLGRVPEAQLPLLYGGACLYVQPSLLEGFGFPVLEAMGCGAPVVCSDIPALRELAANAALYFDPRREESIAQALREALDNESLRRALGERGRLRARQYTWERAAEHTLKLYARVAEP
jgi:alpha-1,3-rhamnosyl/mannosyltransferase